MLTTVTYESIVIDRSDPNQIVCIIPKNNPHYPEFPNGKSLTRIEDIRLRKWVGRSDLGLVNKIINNKVIDQYCVYGRKNGKIIWGDYRRYFSKKEQIELHEIVERIIKASKEYPEMLDYLQD